MPTISFEEARINSLLGGLFYDPHRHELLPDDAWVKALSKHLQTNGIPCHDRLILYRHRVTEAFVLAYWINRPNENDRPGRLMEVALIPGPPGRSEWNGIEYEVPTMDELVERMRPSADHLKDAIEKEKSLRQARQNELAAKKEYAERVASDFQRYNEGAAAMIRSGMVPVEPESDGTQSVLKNIKMAKSNKVLIDGTKGGD